MPAISSLTLPIIIIINYYTCHDDSHKVYMTKEFIKEKDGAMPRRQHTPENDDSRKKDNYKASCKSHHIRIRVAVTVIQIMSITIVIAFPPCSFVNNEKEQYNEGRKNNNITTTTTPVPLFLHKVVRN